MKGYEMENYIEMDRMGFEKWKNMSKEVKTYSIIISLMWNLSSLWSIISLSLQEKQPYVSHARALDYRHQETLNQEANEIIKVTGQW